MITIEGRDVYHKDPDAGELRLDGLGFVIAKATQGLQFEDDTYAVHVEETRAEGLLTGSMHFLEAGDGAAQCDKFLSVADPIADDVHLYSVDVESYCPPGSDVASLHPFPEDLAAFHSRFHDAMPGRLLFVYSYASFWKDLFDSFDLNCSKCRLWTSSLRQGIPMPGEVVGGYPQIYGGFPDLTLHQYATSPLDRDRFYGTREELVALASVDTSQIAQLLASGEDMIQVIQNGSESRFVQLTADGLKVFAPMSGDDLHLVNILVAGGGARIVRINDDRAWATALTHN